MTFIYTIIITLLLAIPLQSTYYMSITDLGISARSIALGNTHGYSDSSEAIFSNPASLINTRGYSFSFFSSHIMNEVDYLQLSLSSSTNFGSIGIGAFNQTVMDIPSTTQHHNAIIGMNKIFKTGSFGYKNSLYKIAYQRLFNNRLSLGLTFNYYDVSINTYTGFGTNFDCGLIIPFQYYNLSIYAQNFIPKRYVHFSHGQSELLPFILSITPIIPINHVSFIPQVTYQKSHLLFSTGISYSPSFLPYITLLSGYKEHLSYTSEKHKRFTFGFGLALYDIDIYYAYERNQDNRLKDHNTYFSLNYQL